MKNYTLICLGLLLTACGSHAPGDYRLEQTVRLKGDGGWDFVRADSENRRIYVAHDTQVEVLNADSGRAVGVIRNLDGAHGIAVAPDVGNGFITNGRRNTVTVFDLKTLHVTGQIETGDKPDAIAYDHHTHRIFAFNADAIQRHGHRCKNGGERLGTIELGGAPGIRNFRQCRQRCS